MSEGPGWCTIESDPGVFTELLSSIGVEDVQVEELYSLDRDQLSAIAPLHGLVFLFRYGGEEGNFASGELCVPCPDGVFFAQQMITNACATQAILSIVLNALDVEIGPELSNFREFVMGMDPATTGLVISNSERIRDAHNSFAPPQHFALEDPDNDREKQDAFHFVSFVPIAGRLYELDGLQAGPRDHGACKGGEWIDLAIQALQARIAAFSASEIRFNLMAVTGDKRKRLRAQLDTLRSEGREMELTGIQEELEREERKWERWHRENVRRRWNFLPFIVSLLKVFAAEGCMDDAVKSVTEKKTKALEEAEKKKKSDGDEKQST